MEKAFLVVAEAEDKTAAATMLEEAANRLFKSPTETREKNIKNQGNGLRVFEVQFNPDSLEFSSTAGAESKTETTEICGEREDAETTKQYVSPEEKQLSFQLQIAGTNTQNVVSGLLRLLTGGKRSVMFCWGKIHFLGELSRIQAEYTMFEHTGAPIRGKVSIGILQSGLKSETEQYWERAFQKLTN